MLREIGWGDSMGGEAERASDGMVDMEGAVVMVIGGEVERETWLGGMVPCCCRAGLNR